MEKRTRKDVRELRENVCVHRDRSRNRKMLGKIKSGRERERERQTEREGERKRTSERVGERRRQIEREREMK